MGSDCVLEKVVESILKKKGWKDATFSQFEWTRPDWEKDPELDLGGGVAVLYRLETDAVFVSAVSGVPLMHFPDPIVTFKSEDQQIEFTRENVHRSRHEFVPVVDYNYLAAYSDKIAVFTGKITASDFDALYDPATPPKTIARFLLISER